jgi:hypothetical protein
METSQHYQKARYLQVMTMIRKKVNRDDGIRGIGGNRERAHR